MIQVTDTHDNTLFIELSNDGSYWNVNSAGIFRKGYSNKKETVAKTEPQQPNNAVSTGSSLSENDEGGITSSEPNGKPTVSSGNDSESAATGQGKAGKSSPAAPARASGAAVAENHGTVMPGPNVAAVKVVEVPKYKYKGTAMQAKEQAVSDAKGRSTKADDPLAGMAEMAEAGIAQANRNRMKQTFMNFATNHPSDAVTVGDMWLHYDGADGQWHPVFPDIGAGDDAATVARKLKDFNAVMREQAWEAPEDYLHGKDAVGVPYIIRLGDIREHQVTVRRGGCDFVLTVNGSPRAAQALNGLSNPSSIEGKLLQAAANVAGYVTRAMSQWYTQRNPSFVMGNFIRDMQYANSTAWVKESAVYARRFNLNCAKYNPAALRALFHKYRRGTIDMGKPAEKHFHEFMHEGGETGSCF